MKKRFAFYRIVSAVLALQLISAPVAMAYAATAPNLGETQADFPSDMGEVIPPEQTLTPPTPQPTLGFDPEGNALAAPASGFYYSDLSMGVPMDENGYLALCNSYFNAESARDLDRWGLRRGTDSGYTADVQNFFVRLPSVADIGRVPDLKFREFYVYETNRVTEKDRWLWDYADINTSNGAPVALSEPYAGNDVLGLDMSPDTGKTVKLQSKYNFLDSAKGVETLPIVGGWDPSDNAAITGLGLTPVSAGVAGTPISAVYTGSIAGKNTDTMAADKLDLAALKGSTKTDFWVRVPGNAETLNLTFDTYEPYYRYNTQDPSGKIACPVKVEGAFAGQPLNLAAPLKATMLPVPKTGPGGVGTIPQNTVGDPAHAQWSLDAIPLSISQGTGKEFTTLTITVTAPDEKTQKVYHLHVQRMADPTLARQFGNTPLGMLESDTSAVWGVQPAAIAAKKAEAKAAFERNNHFDFTAGAYPQDDSHQQGAIFKNSFTPDAWGKGENFDRDETPIVGYLDTAFLDPGIALTDGEGNPVDMTKGAVSRTLRLRTAPQLSADLVHEKGGTECYYAGGKLESTEKSEVLLKSDGSDQIDLRGLMVLPGIYTIEYAYTDPVTGVTVSTQNSAGLTDQTKKGTFSRTLILLPIPGDVNMDGAVTAADAVALKSALNLPNAEANATQFCGHSLTNDPVTALFAFRVCDRDYNGVLNQDDINKAMKGFVPALLHTENMGYSDYHYLPLPQEKNTVPAYTRKAWSDITQEIGGATLTLEYLGVETGLRQPSGATVSPCGPWLAEKKGVTLPVNTGSGVTGDTFWMAVKLSDVAKSALLKDTEISELTLSLIYDTRYVTPAVVATGDELLIQGNTFADKWNYTILSRNLAGNNAENTLWGKQGNYALTVGARPDGPYTEHYSKVIPDLEQGMVPSEKKYLKELVFSVELQEGRVPSEFRDGYLLAVPFTLVKHPYGQKTAHLVELGAGMRELTFVGKQQTASGFAALFALPIPTTGAYSAQARIFGGKTENLKESLQYAQGGTLSEIPLGEDKTEAVTLPAGEYSEPYTTTVTPYNQVMTGSLPDGMKYSGNVISGTPTKAGTYRFQISDIRYTLTVGKKTLRYYANSANSYYGQPEYRGQASKEMTFRYRTEDVGSLDKAYAAAQNLPVNGDGAGLGEILQETKFVAPTFTARETRGGGEATAHTKVGTYNIEVQSVPIPANYNLSFEPAPMENAVPINANKLYIIQRPVIVERITQDYVVGEIYNDVGLSKSDLVATAGQTNPAFAMMLPIETANGMYENFPLTGAAQLPGDVLQLRFEADWQQTETDKGIAGSFFKMDSPLETRSVKITILKTEGDWTNYRLVRSDPLYNFKADAADPYHYAGAKGQVKLREVENIRIAKLPDQMEIGYQFTYGDVLASTNGLHITVEKGGGDSSTVAFGAEVCEDYGFHVNWVTKAEMEEGKRKDDYTGTGRDAAGNDTHWFGGDNPFTAGQVETTTPFQVADNGQYLCVSITKGIGGQSKVIKEYSEKPVLVQPRGITLTPKPVVRYYGEENGALTYTYETSHLTVQDAQNPAFHNKGTAEELKAILGEGRFTSPSFTVSDKNGALVTAGTPAGTAATIKMSGAKDPTGNYVFRYKTAGGVSDTTGEAALSIVPRPIVVTKIVAPKNTDLATLYADTKREYVTGQTLQQTDVEFGLPEHDATGTTYFLPGGASATKLELVMGSDQAVLPADAGGLNLTYTATVLPDRSAWNGFTNGHYDMGAEAAKAYPVQVGDLALKGDKAGNYRLVYRDNLHAQCSAPAEAKQKLGPQVGQDGQRVYYVSGTGTVMLRPIAAFKVTKTPNLNYRYGDAFDASLVDKVTGKGLTVEIQYDTKYDNFLTGDKKSAGNTTHEEVKFEISKIDPITQKITTSFEERGLTIGYSDPKNPLPTGGTETEKEQYIADHTLAFRQYLTVTHHHGTHLFVSGRRGAADPLIVSAPMKNPLTVAALPLTLTASDVHRFYGEENNVEGDFAFTFDEKELAPLDKAALKAAGKTGIDGTAALTALAADRGFSYTAPTFNQFSATAKSPVKPAPEGYPLALQGGALDNYTFRYQQGTIHVYRRPVTITKFYSSLQNPLYTIFSDQETYQFETNAQNIEGGTTRFDVAFPNGVTNDTTRPTLCSDNVARDLHLTKTALCPADEFIIKMKVAFTDLKPGALPEGSESKEHNVHVSEIAMVDGEPCKTNYELTNSNVHGDPDVSGVGKVYLRNITGIAIKADSKVKTVYTYGEALSLKALTVSITYNKGASEGSAQVLDVPYIGQNQFASYGLYVNYYDKASVPQNDWEKLLNGTIRRANQGDHLTIAPTHDTQGTLAPFTPNGKYLVVSGRINEKHPLVAPKVYSTPISVAPKQLTYSLQAEDKTYSGDTKAVGTVTLGNVFRMADRVDDYNPDGITDVVFLKTGAAYETPKGTADDHHDFVAFKQHVADAGYRFTTGSYTPNGAPPLGENGTLNYAPGYTYGEGLTFSFADPNVHYEDETTTNAAPAVPSNTAYWTARQSTNTPEGTWDKYGTISTLPVEVTGMVLAGPDAANYTWKTGDDTQRTKTEVRMTSRDAPWEEQDAVPYATIHKANRAKIDVLAPSVARPIIEQDRNTAVAKVTFGQKIDEMQQQNDHFAAETHFEYALRYTAKTGETAQWAGIDGTKPYQDTRFFGGESVAVTVPAGYVPDLTHLPDYEKDKNAVRKGQYYRWVLEDLGFLEDQGFTQDAAAYPGGTPYEGYELYKTNRT
ncbi:MAG: hypothetical protein RSC08_00420, partial [Oscillospiraceae bacterium]